MTIHQIKKIKKLMIDKEVSGAYVARKRGCTRQNIYRTIKGQNKNAETRKAIADALGVPILSLWPGEKEKKAA